MTLENILSRVLFVVVFAGGYLYFTRGIPRTRSGAVSTLCLAAALLLTYLVNEKSFVWSMVRYALFTVIYCSWSLLFLRIRPRYALYLSGFFVILMGVVLGCVQIVFVFLQLQSTILLILVTGLCRIGALLLIRKYGIHITADRDISVHEIILGLFPAFTCFVANQVLYEFVQNARNLLPPGWPLPVSLLVLFFGASAILVLIHTETYFKMNKLQVESELAQQQLSEQYQLFLKEQEAGEQVRALRHDLRNHLHTIEKMAASNDAGTIRQYVSDLQTAAEQAESASVTGNATLDALVSAKMPVFEKNGIRFENYLSMREVALFSPMEICTLFGNAIDNAVEALSDSRVTDKRIHMSGGIIHDSLVVKIENPYGHELRPGQHHFESTKQIARPHGYGLMNIERTIQEHGGSVTYKTDNGMFTMVWMIPL
ncbi:MAG: sensor histidine kinase [Clostridia bacterium]|nr:sensor histidine kinase [Clostridia bacterium]